MTIALKTLIIFAFIFLLSACGSDSRGSCGTVTDIGPSSVTNGSLESGDCTLSILVPTSADNTYADEYRLSLTTPGLITITMRSSTMDSYLFLLDRSESCANGCTAAEARVLNVDDNSGDGVNGSDAQISISLAVGSYIILANSFDIESGHYTLEISF